MATLTSYTGVRFSPRSYCPDYIGFFGKQSVFSNFHPSPIHYKTLQLHDDPNKLQQEMVVDFKTAEAMFQWKKAMSNPVANACYPTPKAVDGDVCYAIRTAATPSRAKQLGRKVELDPLAWDMQARVEAMREVISLKFQPVEMHDLPADWNPNCVYDVSNSNNISLSVHLLCTGNAFLVENSPYDKIWGTGNNHIDFARNVNKISSRTDVSIKIILLHEYSKPLSNNNLEDKNLGSNLLGRILCEQRLKLRKQFFLTKYTFIVKPVSNCNNRLLSKRRKRMTFDQQNDDCKN